MSRSEGDRGSIDLRKWEGLTLTEVIESLLRDEMARSFNKVREHNEFPRKIDAVSYFRHATIFWESYNIHKDEIIDYRSRKDRYIFERYVQISKTQESAGRTFWDWMLCVWLRESVKSLVHALENETVGVVAQRVPVRSLDQPLEAVPFEVFDSGRWLVRRKKSCLEFIGDRGDIKIAYRRARITMLNGQGTPPTEPLTSTAATQDVSRAELVGMMKAMWQVSNTGARKIAHEWPEKYPNIKLTVREIEELVVEARGGIKFKRGRMKGSSKTSNK